MKLPWLNNGFICKDLYAPFIIDKDADYVRDLRKKYSIVLRQAKNSGADDASIKIIEKYTKKS